MIARASGNLTNALELGLHISTSAVTHRVHHLDSVAATLCDLFQRVASLVTRCPCMFGIGAPEDMVKAPKDIGGYGWSQSHGSQSPESRAFNSVTAQRPCNGNGGMHAALGSKYRAVRLGTSIFKAERQEVKRE